MILTEEEARKKECRIGGATKLVHWPAHNETPPETEGRFGFCYGANCMSWRWGGMAKPNGEIARSAAAIEAAKGDPRRIKDFPDSEPAGYCGLAGRVL